MYQKKLVFRLAIAGLVVWGFLCPALVIAQNPDNPIEYAVEKAKKIRQELLDGKRRAGSITESRGLKKTDPEYQDIADFAEDCVEQWRKNPKGPWILSIIIQTSPDQMGHLPSASVEEFLKALKEAGTVASLVIPSSAEIEKWMDGYNEFAGRIPKSPPIPLNEVWNRIRKFLLQQGFSYCHKLMIYLVGHGEHGGMQWWYSREWLAYKKLATVLELLPFGAINVVIDSCYSGSAIEILKDHFTKLSHSPMQKAVNVFTAASGKCQAIGTISGSLYTHFLSTYVLKNKKYYDFLKDNFLNPFEMEVLLEGAHNYAAQKVNKAARKMQRPQPNPRMYRITPKKK